MDRIILPWNPSDGVVALSVVFGRTYKIGARGALAEAGPYAVQDELVYYEEGELGERTGYIRPSLLRRDVDIYPQRARTDLVIQGTARSPQPTRTLTVDLTCRGAQVRLAHRLQISGDRRVERGPTGLRLSEAAKFTEMPVRYDKAYGGTDEHALSIGTDREKARAVYEAVGAAEDREISEFSYPRNPAGKGYVVDPAAAVGTAWPNIEWPEDPLQLDELVLPPGAWGDRPNPAGFDFFPHAWFPRVAFFGEFMPTADGKVPAPEVRQGLLPADLHRKALLDRPKDGFTQAAHPYLWRERLTGDEQIRVTALGKDGAPLEVQLPALTPSVRLRAAGEKEALLPAELDLVWIAADPREVTLVWRATQLLERPALPARWEERTSVTIEWRRP